MSKKKSNKAHLKKKKEFRFHKIELIKANGSVFKIDHPTFVFLEKGNLYIYVSITHSEKVDGEIVIKLKKNPNPEDESDAYYVAKLKEDKKDTFGKKHKNWTIDIDDEQKIRKMYKK